MLPFELISDAANHHALKGLIVALKNKASLKVTLVKRSSSSPSTAVLPYLIGASLATPIFSPNEIARLLGEKSAGSSSTTNSDADLLPDQWMNWEADKLCDALAPLYNQRRFTSEARSVLKHLDSTFADGRASVISAATASSPSSLLADAVVYS